MKGVSMRFFGREIEIAELKRIREISHETSQFTVVTGRRRIGKTELVEKSLNDGAEPFLYLFVFLPCCSKRRAIVCVPSPEANHS